MNEWQHNFKSHSSRKTKTLQDIFTSRLVCKVAAIALAFFFFLFSFQTDHSYHIVTSQKNTMPESVSHTSAFAYNIFLAVVGTSFQFVTVSFSPVLMCLFQSVFSTEIFFSWFSRYCLIEKYWLLPPPRRWGSFVKGQQNCCGWNHSHIIFPCNCIKSDEGRREASREYY